MKELGKSYNTASQQTSLSLFELKRLIESKGHDEEARNGIAEFAQRKMQVFQTIRTFTVPKSPGTGFTGHTDEMGDVQIPDDEKKKTTTFTFGEDMSLRVGNYIMQ